MASKQAGIILGHIRKLAAAQRRDELPDRQLLQRFTGQRDQAAFATLVQRHGPMVLRVCQRVLHNWHDAEDAFQATFLTLARKADSIRKQQSVGSWLHGVAYRLALQANADLRRHAWLPQSPQRPTVDPAAEVTWRELRAMLDEELNRLPEKYRAPLLLCYLGGQTRDEAAHQLGCPLATLKSRLERGRELLRSRLSRRGLTLSAALLATGLSESASPAMLPATLVHSTVQAAPLIAAGNAAAAGVSASVAALTEGVLKAMLLSKVKQAGALVLTICLLGTGTGLLSYHTLATEVSKSPSAQLAPAAARQTEEARNASQVAPEETNDTEPAPASPKAVKSEKSDKPSDKRFSANEVLSKSFRTGRTPRLIVDLQNGAIDITATTEGAIDARVTKEAKAATQEAAREALKSVEVTMKQEDNTVRITARTPSHQPRGVHTDTKAVLRVPPGTTLDVQTVNGAVNLTGATGNGRLASTNGAIYVKDCKSSLDLKTANGAITVRGGAGRLNTRTDNGKIDIQGQKAVVAARSANGAIHFEGTLGDGQQSFHTENGSIILSLPADARFRVEAETGNGRINSEFALASSASKSRTRLSGAVGADPSTTIKLHTQNGSIVLKRLKTAD